MAVPAGPTEQIHIGNGVTTLFAVPFLIIQAQDLAVYVNGVRQNSGYTQAGVGNPSSAVIFAVAPALGSVIVLQLDVPFERVNDYQENGDFLSNTVNRDFDRIWQALKQLLRYAGRALTLGQFDVDGSGWYQAKGNGIRNLADPVQPKDAVNKGWLDAIIANLIASGQGPINSAANVVIAGANGFVGVLQDLAVKGNNLKGVYMLAYRNRTQGQKNDDVVSVADYGGLPTGDGTAAVNAAALAAGAGGQIYIPFSTFTVNNPDANGCRIIGANTILTGVIRNHGGTTGVIVGAGAQDRLRNMLPEASEHAPLFVYRQNSEKYFVMVRKQGGGRGGVIFEMLHNQTTLSSSVGVNAEFLRVCRAHNCTGIYGWQSGPSSETGTWQPYTLTDEEAGHLGDNLQRPVTSRRSTSSGSTATYQITVPRSGRFNVALLGSSASPSTVEIRVDGDLVKTVNPQLFNRFIYTVQCEATPGARSVTVTGVGLGTVYLIGMNFHSIQEAVPGSLYNNWAAYRDPAMTHFILSEGAHDYAIFDRTSQLWAGSYHGGETAREPRQFLLDNVPNDMTDAQVMCAASLVIRQKTKIDWSGYGGGILWSNSETRFAASQVELRASFINEAGSSPRIQRFHTGMNGVNEIFTDMVFPREGTIGDDEIDLGQISKLVMQHPPSRAAVITDVNLHPDIESDRGGMFIQPATGAYKKVYYPWVMNGTRLFTNLSFTCRRTFR